MSVAQDNEKNSTHIGVYRIEEEIGAGAMGKVYRATHETLGKAVALKIIYADDPTGEVAARFLQEGIAASRVRHPNVVEILDAGQDGDKAYMAMQLLEGETLAECLARQGRLPQTYAVDLILPVCAALAAAHDAGVLHRDLKPANIYLSDVGRGDPEPILLDFGISKILGPVDPELTQNPRFLGSPLYIAPEQADGAPGSPLSDQYSLALSLYEALLGVRPFAKYSSSLIQLLRHVAEGDIRRPCELDASIPEDLDAAVFRALSTNPRKRFASVREFGAALLPFASQARRTLWQRSFVDAERTMTSANAPVSDSTRSSRKVQVSVDAVPPTDPNADDIPAADGAATNDETSDFLSHSSLFGDTDADSLRPDLAESSISRRDPYSQLPSGSGGTWEEHDQVTRPSLDRKTLEALGDTSKSKPASTRNVTLALALLVFVLALLIALRPWAPPPQRNFHVALTAAPDGATISIDGAPPKKGTFQGDFPKDGRIHKARIELEGFEPQTVVFRDHAPMDHVTLSPLDRKKPSPLPVTEPPPKVAPAENEGKVSPTSLPPTPRVTSPAPALPKAQSPREKPSPSEPSDPTSEEVSTKPEGSSPKTPEESAPPKEEQHGNPSLHTGNLDPWAQ